MKLFFRFFSHAENLASVRVVVRQFLTGAGFSAHEQETMVLGVDEACSNIIRHAYGSAPGNVIVLRCRRLEDGVVFKLRDFGAPPVPEQLICRSLDLVQPGGLGLHIIRQAFDQVNFRKRKAGTELTLVKSRVLKPARRPRPD